MPIYINLDHVRSIRKAQSGRARIHWALRVEPLVLDETYEAFIARAYRAETGPGE